MKQHIIKSTTTHSSLVVTCHLTPSHFPIINSEKIWRTRAALPKYIFDVYFLSFAVVCQKTWELIENKVDQSFAL